MWFLEPPIHDLARVQEAAGIKSPIRHQRRLNPSDRGRILLRLADKIEANLEELARLESVDRSARAVRMRDHEPHRGCWLERA